MSLPNEYLNDNDIFLIDDNKKNYPQNINYKKKTNQDIYKKNENHIKN